MRAGAGFPFPSSRALTPWERSPISRSPGHDHSWFLLNQRIIEKEFALSGSEQNPDLTGKSIKKVLGRVLPGAIGPVDAFAKRGADFVVRSTLPELVAGMNALTETPLIELEDVEREVLARDRQLANAFGKDAQLTAIRGARAYIGDKLIRVAKPHRILDPKAGPLIAVRLWILTRKDLRGDRDRSFRACAQGEWRAVAWSLRGRGGRGIWRRGNARLPRARRDFPWRVLVLGARG